jgi:hypothetical protein
MNFVKIWKAISIAGKSYGKSKPGTFSNLKYIIEKGEQHAPLSLVPLHGFYLHEQNPIRPTKLPPQQTLLLFRADFSPIFTLLWGFGLSIADV